MARKFLTNIDMAQNQILNLILETIAGNPASPNDGRVWYDSSGTTLKVQIGGSTIDLRARSTMTGTQTASTISNFDTQVRTSRLDQMAAPTASVAMNSQKLTGLTAGTGSGDSVEYAQFQTAIANATAGVEFKNPVKAVSTSNIASMSGTTTVDGVSLGVGDRLLAAGQSTASQNGTWVIQSGAWTRPSDGTFTGGAVVAVDQGTSNADTLWMLTTNGNITIDTTGQTWVKYAAGSTYSAGNGISIISNIVAAVAAAGGGLSVSGSGIAVDATVERKLEATIPTATSGAFTVTAGTPATVVWNHALNNSAPAFTCRYYTSPGSGNTQGAHLDLDDIATDANNISFTLPTTPASNQYRVHVSG